MFKNFFVAAVVGLAAFSAYAEHHEGNKFGDVQNGVQEQKTHNQEKFSERKQKILQHIEARKSCVTAANNFEDLRACKLHRDKDKS